MAALLSWAKDQGNSPLAQAPFVLIQFTPSVREYLHAALYKAHYEILEDDGSFYGEIPGFQGVYANASTLEECRDELEEVLEEWVLFRVSTNLELPAVDGIELRIKKVG